MQWHISANPTLDNFKYFNTLLLPRMRKIKTNLLGKYKAPQISKPLIRKSSHRGTKLALLCPKNTPISF